MPTHAELSQFVPDVIGRLGYWPYGEPEPVAGGSLNWNFGIESEGERLFVRRYRDDLPAARIRAEHALLRWVSERGIPAPVAYKTETDETVLSVAGGNWSVFPWVKGEVKERGKLTVQQTNLLGTVHGATQAVLASHPESGDAALAMRWDKAESIDYLERILGVAVSRGAAGTMRDGIARQLEMLRDLDVRPPEEFLSLPAQLLHGDFHDHQVLWAGEGIVAVVDWEIFGPNPRVWEVIRSLAFSKLLGAPAMEDYLHGHRRFVQLNEGECRLGLQLWWQSRVVGVWVWAAYFLQGNERVLKFIPEVIAELERISDDAWKREVEERFVRAACG